MAKRIKDVATELNVSSQTIRNYLRLGDQYFSEDATHPTRKRFNNSDIRQLQRIKQLLDTGLTYEDIPDELTPAARVIHNGHDVGQEDTDTDQTPEDTPPEDTQKTTDLAIQYEPIIAAQQQTIQTLNDHINTLKSDKDRLQHQVDQLQNKLDRERLPWWRRLFDN